MNRIIHLFGPRYKFQQTFNNFRSHISSSSAICTSKKSISDNPKLSHEEQYEEQQKRNKEAGVLTELVRDFLDPAAFYNELRKIGIDFFTGVPDSLLKDFCAYVSDNVPSEDHIITCNEGSAIALASGYHLATGKIPCVYMQNSGLGNAVNPIVSLCAREVYSIPLLVLIGWRGEPGKRDEPQHRVQGQVTPGLLASLSIPFQPLPDYMEGAQQALYTASKHLERTGTPYALLIKRQTFSPYKLSKANPERGEMSREFAIESIISSLHDRDIVVATTGMLSRELYELRKKRQEGHEKDFLTVGSMGHALSISLGIAIKKEKRRVVCLDGDGSLIMHMGGMATVGQMGPQNLTHIVLNNGVHDSVGGQPTSAFSDSFSITNIAKAVGYKNTFIATTHEEIIESVVQCKSLLGPNLIEVRIAKGSRKDLGRPTSTPIQNKIDLMHFLAINGN